jgi:hypothetical protein
MSKDWSRGVHLQVEEREGIFLWLCGRVVKGCWWCPKVAERAALGVCIAYCIGYIDEREQAKEPDRLQRKLIACVVWFNKE